MSKRTVFTTLTPLPASISRETVMETLLDHSEMIMLNPLVEAFHAIKPPPEATPEEYHCTWYSLTDRVSYLPGGLISGKVSYNACFHDLPAGLQTHVYAPMGLNIRGKWTLGGSLPGEPVAPVELGLGAPISGLYLREDVDMRCNIMMAGFVKKTLKKAHGHLVARLLVKAQIVDAGESNKRLNDKSRMEHGNGNGNAQGSGNGAYSPASFDQRSGYGDSEEGRRWDGAGARAAVAAPQLPPLGRQSPSLGFRAPELADSKGKTDEQNLYPRPLSVRSSTASWNGSADGRLSYQEAQKERVSWSTLNGGRRTPTKQFEQVAREQPGTYGSQGFHAELDSTERSPKNAYRAPPAHYAEL